MAAARRADSWLAALMLGAVIMLLVPLPTAFVDLLLSTQLAVAVVLVLASARLGGADRLAVFPTLLLCTTFFRLVLNVSTTRLILAHGDAGDVVYSFGHVAVADNLVVGLVLLLMITLVQLLVVARGSERVAEVAARFSLDAMPGRQLAIDADVRAGFIDARQAAERRGALQRESQFYGAMDGAMRFVKGDAVIALVIAFINVLGGMIVGMALRGMDAMGAATTYLMLSIGDGLAAQIPALLMAVAAGLAVTSAATDQTVGQQTEPRDAGDNNSDSDRRDTGRGRRASTWLPTRSLAAVGLLFVVLACLPGLPTVPFACIAGVALGLTCWRWQRASAADVDVDQDEHGAKDRGYVLEPEVSDARSIRPRPELELELGIELARMLDAERVDGEFARRVLIPTRRRLAARIGVTVPAFAVRVLAAPARGYGLRVRGTLVDGIGFDRSDDLLGDLSDDLSGDLLSERISRALERYAFELIDVQSVSSALEVLARTRPALVREAASLIDRVRLTALVRRLVRERIAVRDLADVLAALTDCAAGAGVSRELPVLLGHVRVALRRQISAQHAPYGTLTAWRLDPFIEDTLRGALERDEQGVYLALEPELAADIADAVARATAPATSATPATPESTESTENRPRARVLLTAMDVRRFVAEVVEVQAPDVIVLCPQELTPETEVTTAAIISV